MAQVDGPRQGRNLDSRIRVLHFISNSYRTEYFRLIARHTDRARFAIGVGSLDAPGELQAGLGEFEVPTFALGVESRGLYPHAVIRLAALLRRTRVEVLHAHLFEASLVGLSAAKLAGTKLAIFTGHHSHEVPLYQRRLFLEVDRFAARRLADVVIAPSQEMRDTFVDVYGCPADHVEVIEHGVDLQRFDPAHVDKHVVRTELGLDGKTVFGAISKHHWVKNLEALVAAFGRIAEAESSAHLIILGLGDPAYLEPMIEELGLSERVSLLRPRPDVPEVLAALDVFVHPALAESFGFVVVEAMAMQLPVLATQVGIARDVIEDGITGMRIASTSVSDVTDAMTRALRGRDAWVRIGAAARRRVLEFTPERWVKAHEQLYARRLGRMRETAS